MKKFLGILLAVVGLLLAAAGVVGIVVIGSDDTVDSPTTTITLDGARAVVSTAGVTAFSNTTLRLRVENSGGTVFIGQAHPIDARSYLAGTTTYAVTQVGTSGMRGEVVKGASSAAPPDPTTQAFWTAKAVGPGEQTLDLTLDGTPTQYVIMPVGKTGDITATSGVEVKNGFALSIGATVLGIVGLVTGVMLLRRRRTTGSPITAPTTTSADGDAITSHAPAERSHTLSRIVALAVITTAVPALAGCGVVPTKVDAWKADELTKPAMADHAEAVTVMKDLDVRSAATRTSTAKTFDAKQWAAVQGGPMLATAVLNTQFRELTKDHSVANASFKVDRSFVPALGAYPMFTLVSGSQTVGKEKPEEALKVVMRPSVTAPWVLVATTSATLKTLPRPAEASGPNRLSDSDLKHTQAAVDGLTAQINTGKGGPALPKDLAEYFAEIRSPDEGSATLQAELWNPTPELVDPEGSVHAVKTSTGQLMVVSYNVLVTRTPKAGYVFRDDPENEYRRVTGQTGEQRTLRDRYAMFIALQLDSAGKPTVIGNDVYYVR